MSDLLSSAVFAAGGGLGAVARHAITLVLPHRLPWSTLLVNVAGSLVLGLVAGALLSGDRTVADEAPRLVTGFCGGFTTFSAFSLEAFTLFERGQTGAALTYVVLSVAMSLAALVLGVMVARGFAT